MMNPLAIFLTVRPYYFFSTTKQIVYILPRLVSIKAGAKEKKKNRKSRSYLLDCNVAV